MSWSNTRIAVLSVVLSCVGIGIGVLIGYFGVAPKSPTPPSPPTEDLAIVEKLMNAISAENIRSNLRKLTLKPHIAGRAQDEDVLVEMIRDSWIQSGFDSVKVYSYDVLLSYPEQNNSNYVAVLSENGIESEISQRKELVIDEEQNDPDVVDPFNAYASPGEPEGDLVYVNYATVEDFMELNRTLNINTRGKICIAKYGRIFRGDKAVLAEEYGCKGLILYSDPADYTLPWGGVYPEDWLLPPTGVQRGTLWVDDGDPRTPKYPSIPSAYRKPDKELNLPKIPVTPIGSIDAVKYLEKLGGNPVKDEWNGGLNITYRYGPGFRDEFSTSKIKMSVKTKNYDATTRNVIGYIKGAVEPDRYVILGNHRDAWVFGAIDPTSGTATQLEVARAFGEMVKGGWKPRRTLVFCSWGAEEYGLIGSTEWVEQLQKELSARAIAYLNVDSAVTGNYSFNAAGVNSFRDIVINAAKLVENPDSNQIEEGRETVYDTWRARTKPENSNYPSFPSLGSGSDHAPFLQFLGISATSMNFMIDPNLGLGSYPVYHSVYETFEYMSTYVDPDFKIHRAVGQIWAEMGRKLSDVVILPINCRLYAEDLASKRDALFAGYGTELLANNISRSELDDAINVFAKAAADIHQRIETISQENLLEVRAVNDQLMQLERAFIDMDPLLGRISYRHVITAPSQHNTYGYTAFPGVTDALFDIDADPDQEGRWNEVKRQYSIVVFHILSAAATLEPVV